MTDPTYLTALRLLAGRELSERQLRQRLERRGHEPGAIDAAIARLKAERSLDDTRAAAAMARSEIAVRGRGPLRVRQRLAAAGIDRIVAQEAIAEAFGGIDDEALLQAALGRRLPEGQAIGDDREFQRLFRHLVGRGFEPDRVMSALRARRRRS